MSGWAKLANDSWRHRKFLRVSTEARGLWAMALAYCSDNEAPFIRRDELAHLVAPDEVAVRHIELTEELVRAGLWEWELFGWTLLEEGRLWDYGPAVEVHPERRKMSPALRRQIIERDGSLCGVCGATDDLVIDHIMPIALGGLTEPSNLQVLCRSHNARKAAKHPDDWWEEIVEGALHG